MILPNCFNGLLWLFWRSYRRLWRAKKESMRLFFSAMWRRYAYEDLRLRIT